MSLLGNVTDATLHGLVELEGRLDETRLARALRLLVDVEPVLGCRFVTPDGPPRFERREDLDRLGWCTVEHQPPDGATLGAWLTQAVDPLQAVDPMRDPLVSATLLRGERDVLWLRLSHLAGDAAGLRSCLGRLAELTRALQRDPDHRPTPDPRARRGLGQVTRPQGIWERLRMLRRGLRDLGSRGYPRSWWRFPTTPGIRGASAPGRSYVWHPLGTAQVRAMRDHARAHGATLNDLFVTAYLRALARVIRPGPEVPLRLRFTVDLRRYLPAKGTGAVCNLSTFGFLNAGPGPERSFAELLTRVSAEMRAQKADFLGLGEAALFGPMLASMPYAWLARASQRMQQRPPPPELLTPTLTNMGVLDPRGLAFDGLGVRSAWLLPPVMYPPGFAIAASGFGDTITLSGGFCSSAISRRRVGRLFARMGADLPGSEGEVSA